MISAFTVFTQNRQTCQSWCLSPFPPSGSLSANQLKFQTVLDSPDRDAIVAPVVQKEVHELAYQRVSDWFGYFDKLAKLGCPTRDEIERLAEVKSSRDVLVHNNGIANSIYADKSMDGAICRRRQAGTARTLPS